MIIDTHIHLSHALYDQTFPYLTFDKDEYRIESGTREELIQKYRENGIMACIEPGIDIDSNRKLLELAKHYPLFVYPAVGIHPTRTYQYKTIGKDGEKTEKKLRWHQRKEIEKYSNNPYIVAIGETGLDYHLSWKNQHRIRQRMWFVWQIRLAHKKRLPLILHIREADTDAIRILNRYRHWLHGGICHCFSGDAETAKKYIDLGYGIGIGGTLLKKSSRQTRLDQAIIQIPLEYIYLETDGPYVKPDCPNFTKKQKQKTRNTSLILSAIVNRIAELKEISEEEIIKVTTDNAKRLFEI